MIMVFVALLWEGYRSFGNNSRVLEQMKIFFVKSTLSFQERVHVICFYSFLKDLDKNKKRSNSKQIPFIFSLYLFVYFDLFACLESPFRGVYPG